MAEPYRQLPAEKRRRILDAALEEFAKKDYKSASTDDIAARAGISQGLLFYYFKNKQSLYLALAEETKERIEGHLKLQKMRQITDFFDILEFGVQKKLHYLKNIPWMLEFSLRMYYASGNDFGVRLQRYTTGLIDLMCRQYFAQVDLEKFKPGRTPRQALDLLMYLADGYCHMQRMAGNKLDLDAMMEEYCQWRDMVKQYVYKEEYQ